MEEEELQESETRKCRIRLGEKFKPMDHPQDALVLINKRITRMKTFGGKRDQGTLKKKRGVCRPSEQVSGGSQTRPVTPRMTKLHLYLMPAINPDQDTQPVGASPLTSAQKVTPPIDKSVPLSPSGLPRTSNPPFGILPDVDLRITTIAAEHRLLSTILYEDIMREKIHREMSLSSQHRRQECYSSFLTAFWENIAG